jgi:hypothetical protein
VNASSESANLKIITVLDVSNVCLMQGEGNRLKVFDNTMLRPKGKKLKEERCCVMRSLITYRLYLHKVALE